MGKYFCEKCDKRIKGIITEKEVVLPVKGENITVKTDIRSCNECGEEVYDEELEQALFEKAYQEYRVLHNILSPDEIKAIREEYSLSQRSLALLLGWGEITIHRYEKGNLPDEAHNQMLKLLAIPENMSQVFEDNKDRLKPQVRKKLEDILQDKGKINHVKSSCTIVSPQEVNPPSINTGMVKFKIETFENMILAFCAYANGVLKTKLMKLMWYADFIHYARYSKSISGATYVALPHGPAPDDYEYYLSEMILNKQISIEETMVVNLPGYKIKSLISPDLQKLPPTAEKVIRGIFELFSGIGSGDISDISHKEAGYKETKIGKPISYKYAEKIKVQIDG